MIPLLDAVKCSRLTELDISQTGIGPPTATMLVKLISDATSFTAIERLDVSGCDLRGHQEVGAQLMTAANEVGRTRLRAYQVLAFSGVIHERLGSSCAIDAVGDMCSRVADEVRRLHGHEALCSRLFGRGQTWFELAIRGLITEGVPSRSR